MAQSPTGHDQAGLVEQGQELGRADQPPLGVGPPQQGLDADQLVVVQGHDRQVEQPELLALEGLAQAPLGRRRPSPWAAWTGRTPPRRPGRSVSACCRATVASLQQRPRRRWPGGRAWRCRRWWPPAGGRCRCGTATPQRGLELVGAPGGGRGVGHVGVEHRELGAARAEQPLAGAQRPRRAGRPRPPAGRRPPRGRRCR